MTISSSTRKAGPYTGNGVATSFAFSFKVFTEADLQVVRLTSGVETALVLNSDYSVTLNADQNASPGGSITYPISGTPLSALETLTIAGDIEALQPAALSSTGGFYPRVIEDALDRAVILAQQMVEKVSRSIRGPLSDSASLNMELPVAASRASKALGFDAYGQPIAFDPASAVTSADAVTALDGSSGSLWTTVAGFIAKIISSTGSSVVGFLQGGTSAVARSAQDKLRESVSVFDFMTAAQKAGAVDGSVDVAAPVQAALDSGASRIYIPAGYYKIGSTLNIPASVTIIEGDKLDTILFSATASGNYLISLNNASVTLRDMVLYGGDVLNAEAVPTARNGISASVAGQRGRWQNLVVYGFDTGAYCGETSAGSYMHVFDQCDFNECNTGMRVVQGMHQSTFLNCTFRSNKQYGLRIDPTNNGSEVVALGIYNCTFERTEGANGALFMRNVRGVDISGCYFEWNGGQSILLYGHSSNGSQNVNITGCYFFFAAGASRYGHGVRVSADTSNVRIEGNHFEGYNQAGYFPVSLVFYCGLTTYITANTYNNCTGNARQVETDFGYRTLNKGSITNHTICRSSGKTDGSGNLASANLGRVTLANTSAQLIVKITTFRGTDNLTTVLDTTVTYMRIAYSGGVAHMATGGTFPAGVTAPIGTTTTVNGAYSADLNIQVAGGAASTNHAFIAELMYDSNALLSGGAEQTSAYA